MANAVYLHVPLSRAEARALIALAQTAGIHPRFYLAEFWRQEAIQRGLLAPEAEEPRIRRRGVRSRTDAANNAARES